MYESTNVNSFIIYYIVTYRCIDIILRQKYIIHLYSDANLTLLISTLILVHKHTPFIYTSELAQSQRALITYSTIFII